ncbi:unnamed protein product [Lymnaea stagnalis]|uniref:TNF family profile domain-containing protein n=1 Tax=Lymnaea stagnalis TaxID=6523 RepID=A0AAV2HDN7_LYMST
MKLSKKGSEDTSQISIHKGGGVKQSMEKSDVCLQLIPCSYTTSKDHSEAELCSPNKVLSITTQKLVAVIVGVGLVLSNVHLQMRVSDLEDMVARLKAGHSICHEQKSQTAEQDHRATAGPHLSQGDRDVLAPDETASGHGRVSRRKRSATKCDGLGMRDLLQDYCKFGAGPAKLKAGSLDVAQFEAVFDEDTFKRLKGKEKCVHIPSDKVLCAGGKVTYINKVSRLDVYSDKELDNSKIAKMKEGHTFVIQTAGVYLISLNISIYDNTSTKYLAIFLNNMMVMACPEGGSKCFTSLRGLCHVHIRICYINGVLKLHANDTLDVRTMIDDTTIRIEPHNTSYLSFVLLQKQ